MFQKMVFLIVQVVHMIRCVTVKYGAFKIWTPENKATMPHPQIYNNI